MQSDDSLLKAIYFGYFNQFHFNKEFKKYAGFIPTQRKMSSFYNSAKRSRIMQNLIVNLAVRDIRESIAFYRDILGFNVVMAVPNDKSDFSPLLSEDKKYLFAMVQSGNVEIMLQEEDSLREDVSDFFSHIGASVTFYMKVDDVNAWYQHIASKVDIVRPLETSWYGMREFYIRDINGYILGFAQQVA
jgi:uncharacterized glyoxalase superfamily protein PhnB